MQVYIIKFIVLKQLCTNKTVIRVVHAVLCFEQTQQNLQYKYIFFDPPHFGGRQLLTQLYSITGFHNGSVSLDIIGVPDFSSGAMENWGIVTFKETNILINPNSSNYMDYFSVVNVVCHEIAHMWFGNLGNYFFFLYFLMLSFINYF